MHGTSAPSRGICSRISAGAGAFGRWRNRFLFALSSRVACPSWRRFGVCLS
jgi:hypothetical protein